MIRTLTGDCRTILPTLPAESVQCCVTSPPYFGLRDYGVDGQIGLEQTPEAYVAELVAVFREVKRVLRPDGVVFLNLGDSYSSVDTSSGKSYILRDDLSTEEKADVCLEMFGVRIDGYQEKGEGSLSPVLSCSVGEGEVRERPYLESQGITPRVSQASGDCAGKKCGTIPGAEGGSHNGAGRSVRLLRGNDAGVSDGRSHSWRRGDAQEDADGEDQGELCDGISGHQAQGLPEGSVPSSLHELQFLDRCLGILSARPVAQDLIPRTALRFFRPSGLKPKDLIGIPWRVAFALQADGWYLRQDIIWAKPNPMTESVRDRCTKAHEYVFLLSKSARYYFDAAAIHEPDVGADHPRMVLDGQPALEPSGGIAPPHRGLRLAEGRNGLGRNRRSVWTVATQPYSGAHFATFPPALILPMILAGCPPGGTVLDPFAGSGTTGAVAAANGREALLIELNPAYVNMANGRGGLFAQEAVA